MKLWPYAVRDIHGKIVASLTIEGPADGVGMMDAANAAFRALGFVSGEDYMTMPPIKLDGDLR